MSDLSARLIAKYFHVSRDSLVIGGLPIEEIAAEVGTPAYIYDKAILNLKYDALRTALPISFCICYSIKANPCRAVVRHFLSRGCGIEIASAGEFTKASQAGCPPEHMLFAGPGKTTSELEFVLAHRIGEIHVESLTEARRIAEICRRLGARAQIALRINPIGDIEGGAMRMGGRPSPFGIDEENLEQAVNEMLALPEIDLCAIHLFTGTQILDSSILITQYRHGLELARRVARRVGRPLKTLDFGGGLGIPYFQHETELDLDALRIGLAALWHEVDADPNFAGTRFLVEPGRFLVGEAGIYLTRIIDIKVSRGKKFVIVDGGMHHHLAASGNLGQTIKRNYPIGILNKLGASPEEAVEIVGPLCTPLDTLGRNVRLPHAEIGDLVGIFQSGAYGRSASPLAFLSHPHPPEMFIDGERREVFHPYSDLGDSTPGKCVEVLGGNE